MRFRALVPLIAVLALPGLAVAAQVTELPPGGTIEGATPELPAVLAVDQKVTGPAVITADDGSVIRLKANAVLRMLLPGKEGREEFFLSSGVLTGEIRARTDLVLPVGRMVGPLEGSATVYLDAQSAESALYKVDDGRALVAHGAIPYPEHHLLLSAGQSVLLLKEKARLDALKLDSLPYNTQLMVMIARVSGTVEIVLGIPRSTILLVEQIENGAKTKISSDAGSQGGRVSIQTLVESSTGMGKSGAIGPGTFAIIDNTTGTLTFGEEEEIDYGAMIRTVSLTSEFQVLALSNFNTIAPQNLKR